MLDELTTAGEVTWVGDGAIGDSDGWVRWYVADAEPHPVRTEPAHYRSQELLAALAHGRCPLLRLAAAARCAGRRPRRVRRRAVGSGLGRPGHQRHVPPRTGAGRRRGPQATVPPGRAGPTAPGWPGAASVGRPGPPRVVSPTTAGRWSLVERGETTPAERLAADVFGQLDRYGVVTRGSVLTENSEGGFGAAYRALSAMEESGQCRRGYFIDGLGAAQFALTGAVDRLRSQQREPEVPTAMVLAAVDPANPYGAALPWPEREGHRPGRKAGALVVLVDGFLVFYVERGGKSLLSFTERTELLAPAAAALAGSVQHGLLGKMTVERADGEHVFSSEAGQRGAAGGRVPDDPPGAAAATVADLRCDGPGLRVRLDARLRPRPGPSPVRSGSVVTCS